MGTRAVKGLLNPAGSAGFDFAGDAVVFPVRNDAALDQVV